MARLTRSIHVRIDGDRKLTLAFLEWTGRERIYPLAGTGGSVGPDFVSQTYDVRHADRIEQFIIDNEGRPD